jgi:hypothetical protein
MARNRGKKALYEVMSKARVKPGPDRIVEQLHPKKADGPEPEKEKKPVLEKPRVAAQWWNKPRIAQLNGGRIEFSLHYQIVIAIVLGLILLVLIAYRLGQLSMAKQETAGPVRLTNNETLENRTEQNDRAEMQRAEPVTQDPPARQAVAAAQSTGNNVLVLTQYGARADLVPVQEYFAKNGVELDIVLENGRYFLQTKDTFDNPNNPGTNGYKMKQIITKIGAAYKDEAPQGYEKFAPHYFSDAYGKKVK